MMNSDAVKMQEAVFPGEEFELFGTQGRLGSPYAIKMRSEELQGYGFNKVLYSPAMGLGLEARIVAMLQLTSGENPLADRRSAIEFIGMTDHPEEMMKRIDADMERRVEQQVRLRTLASGGRAGAPTAPTGPEAVLKGAASLEAGGQPPALGAAGAAAPAANLPAGAAVPSVAPQGAPAAAAPTLPALDRLSPPSADVGDTSITGLSASPAQQVARIVRTIPDLHAAVYLMEQGTKIIVYCENFIDAKRVRKALANLYEGTVYVRTSKNVPEGARPITT
jgi:hypothetical protein